MAEMLHFVDPETCRGDGICAEVCPTGGVIFELPDHYGASEVHEAYAFKR